MKFMKKAFRQIAMREMKEFVRTHPVLRQKLSDREAATLMLKDAGLETSDRWGEAIISEYLLKLIECIRRGDTDGAMRLLEKLPKRSALKLMEGINRSIQKLASKPMRAGHKSG
jgi:hypothetical protein